MIFISLVVCTLIAGYYFLYFEPKRKMEKVASEAIKLGYKVLKLPYKFMNVSFLELMERDDRSLKVLKE